MNSIVTTPSIPAPTANTLSCVEVAVPLPIPGPFSYLLDPEQMPAAKRGVRVRVPFKNREITGFLVGFRDTPPDQKLKKVIKILDDEPVLSESILRLTAWLAGYYLSSWGEAIEAAVPNWVKQGKRRSEKPPTPQENPPPAPMRIQLTSEQEKAFALIRESLKKERPQPILLYGVTGSGKTELYIRAIREVLTEGRGAIVLVPEIALTEQIRRFFFHHFGGQLEILHSKLSDGERFSAWKRIEAGEKRVLLGPRSAIFAPMANLGLILIDEEHEGSYKQEQSPRYHAREVALWRAREENALLILGSATPSLESMSLVESGVFQRADLTKRVEERGMPKVTIVDLKREREIQRHSPIFSRLLLQEIETNLRNKEGTLLLLNRRGFSTQVHCPSCGEVIHCPSCEVSLTYHQEDRKLLCHYCNYRIEIPDTCGRCSKPLLRFLGYGTEKVESELGRVFPEARVARMDTDTLRRKGSHEKILQDFRSQKIDVLVGTQMIAKGFDFPHVTLVGVILADVGLVLPDFRSSERTFQLLTQVAGRAGRGQKPGRVIVQTYSPNHPSVLCAKTHDYLSFYEQEMKKRIEHGYPPEKHLINILIRSKIEKRAYLFARQFRDTLAAVIARSPEGATKQSKTEIASATSGAPPRNDCEVLGPAPLPFYRLRGHFRWHVLIKTAEIEDAHRLLQASLARVKRSSLVAMQIDVNPLNIL